MSQIEAVNTHKSELCCDEAVTPQVVIHMV